MRAWALAAVVLLSACADGGKKPDYPSEWEQKNARILSDAAPDTVPPLPPYPKSQDLLPFFATAASDFKFFVDRSSLSAGAGQVRYTLVARSPSGAENISFEALNCKEREFRSYARGTSGGGWITRPTAWRRIDARAQPAQYALHWEYLCPNSIAVNDAAEGIMALEKGGHPLSKLPTGAGGGGSGR